MKERQKVVHMLLQTICNSINYYELSFFYFLKPANNWFFFIYFQGLSYNIMIAKGKLHKPFCPLYHVKLFFLSYYKTNKKKYFKKLSSLKHWILTLLGTSFLKGYYYKAIKPQGKKVKAL